ncbi:MAG: HIT domain-containing protein [Methylococcales bacterium]|jgi:diadenosine tetraphosphate (Ap4A) HIT family hydrolase|nr:HIT domain-containing protein [Methylococcales bacterium]MBT7408900.1 HIT domain-containing protein [Methylococcales bacterium]
MFILNEKLANDCIIIGSFPLSLLLLMNDSQYPWFILVPQQENLTEIYQLEMDDQHQLLKESCDLSKYLMENFNADKLNLGAIGNIVSQLHFHHIVRYKNDIAWPSPVWGFAKAKPYDSAQISHIKSGIIDSFEADLTPL